MRKGLWPPSLSPANPSPRPPGPAKRSITPYVLRTRAVPHHILIGRYTGSKRDCQAERQLPLGNVPCRCRRATVADIKNTEARSRNMAAIRGKDTRPELRLRKALHARGFRYRLHPAGLPGRPDLLLPKYRAAVFVHGCFWHRHSGCRYTTTPGNSGRLLAIEVSTKHGARCAGSRGIERKRVARGRDLGMCSSRRPRGQGDQRTLRVAARLWIAV